MAEKEFQELIKRREKFLAATKANNFNFGPLLAGQYNDPSHFIYEILQNAEDANAKTISFDLYDDYLKIIHNGKDFDCNDVEGITGIGISTKKDDLNKIGKFGVGFKSVFAITKSPAIYSGKYHFQIQDFVLPRVLKNISTRKNTTIILPFNHNKRNKEEVFSIIENKLQNIGLISLLFLSNIETIEWKSKTKIGKYFKRTKKIFSLKNVKKVEIFLKNDGLEIVERYIVVKKNIYIDTQKLKIEIAFKIDKDQDNNDIIVPIKNSKLVVFFPTEKITFLNFLIQGPFKTTPNRENIPLDDEQNIMLIEEVAELVAQSLSIIKKLKLLNVSFLEILPLSHSYSSDIIYSKIFKRIRKEFLEGEELLPTTTSAYCKPDQALLARGRELAKLLNKSDLKFLFNKNNWLDLNIKLNKTQDLRSYLLWELEIQEISFTNFAEKISKEFLERKKDNWMIKFYSSLLNQNNLWEKSKYNPGALRKKPIIRLSNGEHIPPFDEQDHIQVYFPSADNTYFKTIKKVLLKNKKSLEFLKQLGLSRPDIFAELKEFVLPKYSNLEVTIHDEYFEDFKKIFETYEKISDNHKNELAKRVQDLRIISCTHNGTQKSFLKKPTEVYLNLPDLIDYFECFEGIFFIDGKIFSNIESKNFIHFLITIGLNCVPRRKISEPHLSWSEKNELRKGVGNTSDIYEIDYDLEGLENFLKIITLNRSLVLWDILLKSIGNFKKSNDSNYFSGRYKWQFYRAYEVEFDSKFLKILKKTPWLYTKNDEIKTPQEISTFDLKEDYIISNENANYLIEALGFISDEIKQFLKRTGSVLIPKKEFKEFQEFTAQKEAKREKEAILEWKPEIEVDKISPVIEEVDLKYIQLRDLKDENLRKLLYENLDQEIIKNKSTEEEKKKKSKKTLDNIGKWGEEYVYKTLIEKYNLSKKGQETDLGLQSFEEGQNIFEIHWLNKKTESGKGCDFIILRNDKAIQYIEVKSKIDNYEDYIQITGTQWEFARQLYNKNSGEQYYIYIVENAGKSNSRIKVIQNPIHLWHQGKLYAHPINFKI